MDLLIITPYKSAWFGNRVRVYVLSFPKRKMRIISQLTDKLRMTDVVPSRVAALVRDLNW